MFGEVIVREKNQITIPQPVLDYLNIKVGGRIRFEANKNKEIVIHKVISRKITNNKNGKGCGNTTACGEERTPNMEENQDEKNIKKQEDERGGEAVDKERNADRGSRDIDLVEET